MHPQRRALHDELHSRPSIDLPGSALVHHYALLDEDGAIGQALLERLARDHGVPPDHQAAQHILELDGMTLKWERHTEFFTLTLYRPAVPGETHWPAPPEVLERLLSPHREAIINASLVRVEAQEHWGGAPAAYGFRGTAGSQVGGGAASVWSDFHLSDCGVNRLLVINERLNDFRLGRMVRRLLEIETYRMMASLALPLAKSLSGELQAQEQALAELTHRNAQAPRGDTRPLLEEVSALSARIAHTCSQARQRFSATEAYASLVAERIEELRESRIDDRQRLGYFILRRFRPTVRYCAATDQRLISLEQRVAHLGDLLQARAQVEMEAQNSAILQSLNERTSRQLAIQRAVEGLSMIVLGYYILSLYKLGVESLSAVVPHEPRLVSLALAPVALALLIGVALHIRRVRKHSK